MIRSMTGFGRGENNSATKQIAVEIKSVNHRYTDITIKMPRNLTVLEDNIRKCVQNVISRGKVDFFLSYTDLSNTGEYVVLDEALAKSYIENAKRAAAKLNVIDDIGASVFFGLQDVFTVAKSETDYDVVWENIEPAVNNSITAFLSMKEREGETLKKVLLEILNKIVNLVEIVEKKAPSVPLEYKAKMESRIAELLNTESMDSQRLAVEIAMFADKCNIDEEIARMYSHIEQFRSILDNENTVGRKLDFLVQEMNREINTMGSKANDIVITNTVIELKCDIEKLREQIQNLE